MVIQVFVNEEIIGPHVQEGHYDLIGPDGEIILPVLWDKVIRPGMQISMEMWPQDKEPLKQATEETGDFQPQHKRTSSKQRTNLRFHPTLRRLLGKDEPLRPTGFPDSQPLTGSSHSRNARQ